MRRISSGIGFTSFGLGALVLGSSHSR